MSVSMPKAAAKKIFLADHPTPNSTKFKAMIEFLYSMMMKSIFLPLIGRKTLV
jgi:hypothetical protein